MSPTATTARVMVDAQRSAGYACGLVSRFVDGPAEVRLHRPIPLGAPLEAERHGDGRVTLHHDGVLVASGEPALPLDLEPPEHVAATATTATLTGRGRVGPERVWAALEPALRAPGLLARMTAELISPVSAGHSLLALGWPLGGTDADRHTAAALLAADGRVLALAQARWVQARA